MIELPDGRISRTLPEQVGFNAKKIKEIIDLLNTSDINTKLIDLGTSVFPLTGTLTDAQREVANLPISFIRLNERLYLKARDSASYILFICPDDESETDGQGISEILNHWIRITKADNTWAYQHNNIISFYDPDKTDELLALKADLAGATFTGAVKAPTLQQTNANWSIEDDSFTITAPTGLSVSKGYCRVEEINKVLILVFTFSLTNTTAASISVSNLVGLGINMGNDSPEICSAIYDVNGKNLEDSSGTSALVGILGFRYSQDGGNPGAGFYTGGNATLSRTGSIARQMSIQLRDAGNIAAGATHTFTGRTFLTLI